MNNTATGIPSKEPVAWLTVLRGAAVLLIVLYHSPMNLETGEGWLVKAFQSLNLLFSHRMPLFIFISGFLLFHTKLRKNESIGSVLKTRLPRILAPYVFLTISLFLLKGFFAESFKQSVDLSAHGLLMVFAYPIQNPLITLWFLNAVAIYFITYPLLQYALISHKKTALLVAFALLLHIFTPDDILLLDLTTVLRFYIYFVGGIVIARYRIYDRLKLWWVIVLAIVWIGLLLLEHRGLIFNISAILVSVYLAQKLVVVVPRIFSSFSRYYYQIYLFGTLFQIALFELFTGMNISHNLLLITLVSIVGGLYIPVLGGKLIEKINFKALNLIAGFKTSGSNS